MAKGREIKLPLPAADDLFSTQEERDEAKREYVADIPLIEISDFPNHPYKVKQDESMLELAASIREKGVVNPALVRPKPEGGYEMVAGHRRKFASELAGKAVMPCIVRNLTDDEATIIMVDSNLQREKVLPSEKAFAYKMKLDAMKRQGKRSDLTSVPLAQKLQGKTSRQLLGEQVGESQDQIRRYIRLMPLDDVAIISKYNSEIRGLYNYYRLAINVCNLGKFHSIMRGSCLKTLAAKYNSSVMKMYKKYRSVKGDFGADYKTKSGTKRCEFYNEGFRRNNNIAPEFVDIMPKYRGQIKPNSLAGRLKSGQCEMCGANPVKVYMHHVKRLKDLNADNEFDELMLLKRRKSLALCPKCYEEAKTKSLKL